MAMLFGVVSNPWVLEYFFSPDGKLDFWWKYVAVLFFNFIIIFFGFIVYKKATWIANKPQELILLVVSIIIGVFITEIGIRQIGWRSLDGQFWIASKRLRPYVLPVKALEETADVLGQEGLIDIQADPLLGWSPTPGYQKPGLYKYNSIGVRSEKEFDVIKPEGVTRIAFFGDSFVHGNDFPLEDSMPYNLDLMLPDSKYEVMNFAVSGYGIDQAYLRWKSAGQEYKPDIVFIGFQAENCNRNLNIVSQLYFLRSSPKIKIYFPVKPRFIFKNDSLELINYPTLSARELSDVLKDFDNHPLSSYEHYYNSYDYKPQPLLEHSKILALLNSILIKTPIVHGPAREQLCYSILEKFFTEASQESKVYILHIPIKSDIKRLVNNTALWYQVFLDRLKQDFTLIDPAPELLRFAQENSVADLFGLNQFDHYSPTANKIIAEVVKSSIIKE